MRNNRELSPLFPKADYAELQGDMKFEITHSIADVSENVDALILLTEWADFKTYPWGEVVGRMKKPVFFDTKNFLNQTSMKSGGFQYYSIGRRTETYLFSIPPMSGNFGGLDS